MKLHEQLTSVELSNRLKDLGLTAPSVFYREWRGAKENEIEMMFNAAPEYYLDGVNCYTLPEIMQSIGFETMNKVPESDLPPDLVPPTDDEGMFKMLFDVDYWGRMLAFLLEKKIISPSR